MPLYKEMIKDEEGTKLAEEIYYKARPNYHFVSVHSLDALIDHKKVEEAHKREEKIERVSQT